MNTVIVTGLSGSGKSIALKALEDLGYYCIDNLPAVLLPNVADEILSGRAEPVQQHHEQIVAASHHAGSQITEALKLHRCTYSAV